MDGHDSDESSTSSVPSMVTGHSSDDSSDDSSDSDSGIGESLKRSLCAVKMPPLEKVIPSNVATTPVPSIIRSLHCVSECTDEHEISTVDAHQSLRKEPELRPELPPSGHVDGGAMASATDRRECLWCCRHAAPDERRTNFPKSRVADGTTHVPHGIGHLKVPCDDFPGCVFVETLHTPQIPAAIISPDCLARSLKCKGFYAYSDFVDNAASLQLTDCDSCQTDVVFKLRRIRGLLYTLPLVGPTEAEREMSELPKFVSQSNCRHLDGSVHVRPTSDVQQLTTEQQRALWHMRLGHVNDRAVSDMHKHAAGVPKLPRADELCKMSYVCSVQGAQSQSQSRRGSRG